jgi:hypothetical protein
VNGEPYGTVNVTVVIGLSKDLRRRRLQVAFIALCREWQRQIGNSPVPGDPNSLRHAVL